MSKIYKNSGISIVIPNYNGKKLLAKNLPEVLKACAECEIIIVDDASTDDSAVFLKENFSQVKVLINKKNLRFARTCNRGVQISSGRLVVLLNNDVAPCKDFLKPLVKKMKDQDVFSAGCREVLSKSGKKVYSGRSEAQVARGLLMHRRAKDQTKPDTYWTAGGSMIVDKKKFLQLGGFDSIYDPGYWEDIDLSFRARQRGWNIKFVPSSLVYHDHESTYSKFFGEEEIIYLSFRNSLLFAWKNFKGCDLLNHFLWLPYNLVLLGIKTRGVFVRAFFGATCRWISFWFEKKVIPH